MRRASFCHLDATGAVAAERGATDVYFAASTIKLGVAIALLHEVDRGEISLSGEIESQHSFRSAAPGAGEFTFSCDEVDVGFPREGALMTLGQCLERMIEVSSNEGTNLIVELVGLDAINAVFRLVGADRTRMQRLIGDEAARDLGLTCETSAGDLASIMRSIIDGQVLSPSSTALLAAHLRAQRFPFLIEDARSLADWGSKSGWVTGIRHDVAWFRRRGAASCEVLAVCTDGFDPDTAQSVLRAVASSVLRGRQTAADVDVVIDRYVSAPEAVSPRIMPAHERTEQ